MSTLNDVGLVTHGEGCFTRNGTTLTGGSTSRMRFVAVSASDGYINARTGYFDYVLFDPLSPRTTILTKYNLNFTC